MTRLSKQQCIGSDWTNPKEITNSDLAGCIYKYDLDIDNVPDERLKAVRGLINKLKRQGEVNLENDLIKMEVGDDTHEKLDHFDPDLFQTWDESMMAIIELNSLFQEGMILEQEQGHIFRDGDNFGKHKNALLEKLASTIDDLERIGLNTDNIVNQIEMVKAYSPQTLKQHMDSKRGAIADLFINTGTSKTRADKIAKAITTEAFECISAADKATTNNPRSKWF